MDECCCQTASPFTKTRGASAGGFGYANLLYRSYGGGFFSRFVWSGPGAYTEEIALDGTITQPAQSRVDATAEWDAFVLTLPSRNGWRQDIVRSLTSETQTFTHISSGVSFSRTFTVEISGPCDSLWEAAILNVRAINWGDIAPVPGQSSFVQAVTSYQANDSGFGGLGVERPPAQTLSPVSIPGWAPPVPFSVGVIATDKLLSGQRAFMRVKKEEQTSPSATDQYFCQGNLPGSGTVELLAEYRRRWFPNFVTASFYSTSLPVPCPF